MKLLHYSAEPFRFDPNRKYQTDYFKPQGLWLSVEGDDDWQAWCDGEGFGLERMKCITEVTLKPGANVLLIDTVEKLDTFNTRFGSSDDYLRTLAWDKVKMLYDGVIIAPYCWERRLTLIWYYGWDCASGVIWNLSAIANVTLKPGERASLP